MFQIRQSEKSFLKKDLKGHLDELTDQAMLTSWVKDGQKKKKSMCKGPAKEVSLTCSNNNRNDNT